MIRDPNLLRVPPCVKLVVIFGARGDVLKFRVQIEIEIPIVGIE
jgi:hypothetical protein